MSIQNVLESEAGITFLGAAAGLVWTFFKSSAWYGAAQRRRFRHALHMLESAVEETYRNYVQAIKESRADGRLTTDERRRAREIARERAIAIARSEGVDLLRELGEDYLDLWMAKLVRKLKGAH